MATDPIVQAAHVEAHHAAARVLRSWPEKTGIDVMKAGAAAELAVEAAWPIIAALIRAQAFTEAADAIEALEDGSTEPFVLTEKAAALVRGLGEETASVDSKINTT